MKLSTEQSILVTPTAFKDSLTARGASEFIQSYLFNRGFRKLTMFPASDGGNGFLDTLAIIHKGSFASVQVPKLGTRFFQPQNIWISDDKKTAALESALLIGLEQVPTGQRNPKNYNSRPLGMAVKAIQRLYPTLETVMIGVGGTATVDYGMGFLEGMGFKILDENGKELSADFQNWMAIRKLVPPPEKLPRLHFIYDAVIPSEGKDDFVSQYGPQKGIRPEDIPAFRSAFAQWKSLFAPSGKISGAGGGLMILPSAFLTCQFDHGTSWFGKSELFTRLLSQADVVITGEGRIDFQTFQGKWLSNFLDFRKKVIVIAGQVDKSLNFPSNWTVLALNDLEPDVSKSIKLTKVLIRQYLEQLAE